MVSANKAELEHIKCFSSPKPRSIATGKLGIAILEGIARKGNGWAKVQFFASVPSDKSAQELRQLFPTGLGTEGPIRLQVVHGKNLEVAKNSHLVILASPPDTIETILSEPGMAAAMAQTTLISMAAGVTLSQMEAMLYPNENQGGIEANERCKMARAMPNMAASHGQSATAIVVAPALLQAPGTSTARLICSFFECVGAFTLIPESQMDAASVVCGSSPAFMALFCDAIIDGAVAGGLPRAQAEVMTAQAVVSTVALLVADGGKKRPSEVREDACASEGVTIQGILDLEMSGVRGSISGAVREATLTLASGSRGKKNGWMS